MDILYEIYKFRDTHSYTEPNYYLVKDGLSYSQAIRFLNEQDKPSDYFMQPYREGYNV